MPEPPPKPASAPYERPGTGGGMGAGTGILSYGLPRPEFTLGHALQAHPNADYTTGVIGKWHLGDAENGWLQHPAIAGIDRYEAILRGIQSYFSWNKVVDGTVVGTTHYSATDKVDAAIEFIDDRGSDPMVSLAGLYAAALTAASACGGSLAVGLVAPRSAG